VLFANFAEAVAEGRGKAQAATLRKAETETVAKRLATSADQVDDVPATRLRKGDSCWSRPATSSRPTAR
jgi:K+-transporting ATPase ATPase B chain